MGVGLSRDYRRRRGDWKGTEKLLMQGKALYPLPLRWTLRKEFQVFPFEFLIGLIRNCLDLQNTLAGGLKRGLWQYQGRGHLSNERQAQVLLI